VISTAAGLVVSRVGTGSDLSEQVLAQLFARCQVLNLAAGVLFLLGIIPGMAHFAFLFFCSSLAALAYWLKLRDQQPAPAAAPGGCTGSDLGRHRAGRYARAGSRLPAHSAGGQGAGRRTASPHQGDP